jgi:hypothetical protein
MDYYLKFSSEAEANAVLYTAHEDSDATPNFRNIDVLGLLYTNDEEPVALDGWHVNVRTADDENGSALEAYQVTPLPTTPRRVWA